MKYSINIDYSRDSLFSDISIKTLKDRYLQSNENSPQDAFARVVNAFADNEEHAQRLYDAVSKHWFMFSTPILSNGGTERGLGISCFLQYVPDNVKGITNHYTESTYLTINGGGLGGYWGDLRTSGKGSKSNGMVPFLKVMDSLMLAGNQAETRRGSYAAYLDVSHPEIERFIDIRDPNTDSHSSCLGIGFHHAVCISDAFMDAVDKDGDWNLIDPHSKEVKKTLKARYLWKKIINARHKSGEPYLMFPDAANEQLPNVLWKKGLRIRQSNLCNEIYLPTGPDYNGKNRTAICCLSSLNIATYDEWKDQAEQLIEDLVRLLDNVLEDFINTAPAEAHQAIYSAKMTRDIGLGTMGLHHYMQSKMIPFESLRASELNNELYYLINKFAIKASEKLGEERGFYPDSYVLKNGFWVSEHKQRNAHVLAIAPNASSAVICGNTSPSIEPYHANAFKHNTLSGSFLTKNPVLERLLEQKGMNISEVWDSIIANEGSVQHLKGLTDDEKLVFKTFGEIDQMWVVELAAIRQPYICMGQSLNLKFTDDATIKHISDVHRSVHSKRLKGLYYMINEARKSSERLSVVKSRETVDPSSVTCLACEG
jgi:ribonucleoside-diphosphate reductase alpha chain